MKKYRVLVFYRTPNEFGETTIEAENEEEAKKIAMKETSIRDFDWEEYPIDFIPELEFDSIEEVDEE